MQKDVQKSTSVNILMLGSSTVGKTNLLSVYSGEGFIPLAKATRGTDYTQVNC